MNFALERHPCGNRLQDTFTLHGQALRAANWDAFVNLLSLGPGRIPWA